MKTSREDTKSAVGGQWPYLPGLGAFCTMRQHVPVYYHALWVNQVHVGLLSDQKQETPDMIFVSMFTQQQKFLIKYFIN